MIGVNVTFDFEGAFDRERVVGVARTRAATFEGMPGVRFKFFTFDEDREARDELLRLGDEGGCGVVLLG